MASEKLIVLCYDLVVFLFSLIFRKDSVVFAAATLEGLFPSTARPYLFPVVTFTSIVGCISRFVFPSSLFRTVVAPLFLVVDGVTVVPTSAEVALLVPLPRGGICMWSYVRSAVYVFE